MPKSYNKKKCLAVALGVSLVLVAVLGAVYVYSTNNSSDEEEEKVENEIAVEFNPIIEEVPKDDFEPDDIVTDDAEKTKAPEDSDRILDNRMLPIMSGWQQEFLDRHNLYRCMHGVPPVTWNVAMYNHVELTFKDAAEMEHSDSFSNTAAEGGPAGENLYWATQANPSNAVDMWYNEVS